MNYKSLKEQENPLNPYDTIVLGGKSAIQNIDRTMRWLEDNQEIEFIAPQKLGVNAEFSIVGDPSRKIWFSQLSSRGMDNDFLSPLLDEITFKGEPTCYIADKFTTAGSFWNAVKGKKFKVKVKGFGYSLNKHSDIVKILEAPAVSGGKISKESTSQSVFDYIREAVNSGKSSTVSGALKAKKAYQLIEI